MIKPILDDSFVPAVYFNRDFLSTAKRPFSIAVEREDYLCIAVIQCLAMTLRKTAFMQNA